MFNDDPKAVDYMIWYLYTLIYPEEPTESIKNRQSSLKSTPLVDHVSFKQIINDVTAPTYNSTLVVLDDPDVKIDAAILNRDENHGVITQDSLQSQNELIIDQLVATFDILLSLLEQDLQIYILREKI